MTIALNEVLDLTVTRLAWAAGQARTLDCAHVIPYDSPAALDVGTAVTHFDADLDDTHPCFVGKIVAREKRLAPGEGYIYHCADAYRIMAKQGCTVQAPNAQGATCQVAVAAGMLLSAAMDKVTACVAAHLPGGVAVDAAFAATAIQTALDRGGAFVADWIDDLLRQTDNGIAYVLPNAGNPKLHIVPFFAQPDVTLVIGTFGILNLAANTLTMIEADGGESLNGRYKSVRIEGAGCFARRTAVQIVGQAGADLGNGLRQWKFPVPNNEKPLRRMIDGSECKDYMKAVVTRGGVQFTIINPPIGKYSNGGWFFELHLADAGGAPTGSFDYTVYTGPLTALATAADARLEGELPEVHDEFFKYLDAATPANNVDHSARLQEIADMRLSQVGSVEWAGNVRLFIRGLNAAIKPGVRIMNLGGAIKPRIGAITYDLVGRSMTCELRQQRAEVEKAKATKRALAAANTGNWTGNTLSKNPASGESNCFSGWKETDGDPESTAELNGPTGGTGGNTGWGDWAADKGRYACAGGQCVPDEHGFYGGKEACEADCGRGWGWYCLDKVNSVCAKTDAPGGSFSAADCAETCTPSDETLVQRWVSFPEGCKQVWTLPSDGYATQAECDGKAERTLGCDGGAVQSVTLNAQGGIVNKSCVTPVNKTVVTNVACANGNIQLTSETIKVWP